jgi:hypothetical protein
MDTPESEEVKEPKSLPPEIDLRWAYSWKCPECHKRNFAASVPVEFMEEEIREMYGLEDYATLTDEQRESAADTFTCPVIVRCKRCQTRYTAVAPEAVMDIAEEEEIDDGEEDAL